MKEKTYKIFVSEKSRPDFIQVYYFRGALSHLEVERICKDILTDPVTQAYKKIGTSGFCVEVAYNPGVMDPWEESVKKAIKDLGIKAEVSVKTSRIYRRRDVLMNKIIQHVVFPGENPFPESPRYKFKLIKVDLLGADDRKLAEISRAGQLFLNLKEMHAIRNYFKMLDRNPVDIELETLAQTWSEHCGHKTLRGKIEYIEGKKKKMIDNLLKNTIMKVTKELKKPWCVSVFKDNAGIIKFDDKHNVCFKVETHNHPSALEPYGGAGTGIGGVIRDTLGTGLGAKPILNTDIFCFGPPSYLSSNLPKGTLHPKRIAKGVVSGVRDYGNKMGIPTANGAVLFDEGYVGNPLVYCGNVGIMPKNKSFKKVSSGELIVVVGGRTGRDGIHGATFSSGELTHKSETVSSGAVQIGNAITEKKVTDCILKARDENLYNAITDCGAGGLSSAVGELGEDTGAVVHLERVPLKYAGLSYTEIWISEAQERMVLSVPRKNLKKLLAIFSSENVEATHIGEFANDKKLKLYYEGNLVCDLGMQFLHKGIPRFQRKAVWVMPRHKEPKFNCPKNLTADLKNILSDPNVASKEWIIRQYDHEVQGGSALKPLAGVNNDGPSDGCICKPVFGSEKGLVITNGINPRYGMIDPYWMAASSIDEALRNIIVSGGDLKKVAILDNFCWGNTDKPDRLGGLVRCSYGCYDAAKTFGVPFISGKDSLNNEYCVHGKSIPIPGTILISAMGIMDNTKTAVTMYAKNIGSLIYLVGETFDELGGSYYFASKGLIGNNAPKVNFKKAKKTMDALSRATKKGLIKAAHDCSEGGLGVAASEMAFSGDLGMEIFLSKVLYESKNRRDDYILFSESNTRFVVEVDPANWKKFETVMKNIPISLIGKTTHSKYFVVYGLNGRRIVDADINELKEAWQAPLRW